MTPAFLVFGFLYLKTRIALHDAQLQWAMEGWWDGLVLFVAWTLLPKIVRRDVALLLLPFALGNAAVTGAVYRATEIVIATFGVGVGGGTSGKIS